MWGLFIKGGPLMWPLLIASLTTFSVVFERALSLWRERGLRKPKDAGIMLRCLQRGDISGATTLGQGSSDVLARTLEYGIRHGRDAFPLAYQRGAQAELARMTRGLAVLDTIITMAPLLGLLGTVTGMIRSFGLLGATQLEAPMAITGGIAEALIATAFGLAIAITSLIPFNWLNNRIERMQHQFQDVGCQAELYLSEARPMEKKREATGVF